MTIKIWAQSIFNTVVTLLLLLVVLTGGLYLKEKTAPVSDFFDYYGNVTSKAEFTYPEEITSYTFGSSKGPLEMYYINRLMCQSGDSFRDAELVATRTKHFETFSFANVLPGIVVRAIDEHNSISQIGAVGEEAIRNSDLTGYIKWSMDNVKPVRTGECYVTAEATTYTPIFRLEKTIRFQGNTFRYTFPE